MVPKSSNNVALAAAGRRREGDRPRGTRASETHPGRRAGKKVRPVRWNACEKQLEGTGSRHADVQAALAANPYRTLTLQESGADR